MVIPKSPKTVLMELVAKSMREVETKRREETDESHTSAHTLKDDLARKGLKVTFVKEGNANYFCVEHDGREILLSPFASQKGWWETPTDTFMKCVKERTPSCRWGIILLQIPDSARKGFWFEGEQYNKALEGKTIQYREKLDIPYAKNAIRKKIAQEFANMDELIHLIRNGLEAPRKRLIKRRK